MTEMPWRLQIAVAAMQRDLGCCRASTQTHNESKGGRCDALASLKQS